jgi:hypothetical protein
VADAEINDGWVKGSIPGPGGRTYEIEHHLVPRTANQPFLRLELSPPNLVLHTTEGTSVDGAISTLTAKFSPSQWIVGEQRIVQTRPLWAQGAAVDTENGKAMQIEMVAKSNLALWLPDEASLHPLVALVAFLDGQKLVAPLTRHAKLAALPLVLDKGPQAKDTYYRRHLGAWPAPGVYGHVDLPCVGAETPVLCADLSWRPAGDLLPGDELVAFDEFPPVGEWAHGGPGRRLGRAAVLGNSVRRDALLLVNTELGSVRCNYQHPWLVKRRKSRFHGDSGAVLQWVAAQDLQPGDEVVHLVEPWESDRSWEGGWLAGLYDGQGSLSFSKSGVHLLVHQREPELADEIVRAVKERTEACIVRRAQQGLGSTPMVVVAIQRRRDAMRMLGSVRPKRLLTNADRVWEGAHLGRMRTYAQVQSVEPQGTGLIAALSTNSGTYIAGGFAMHNSDEHWDPGSFDYPRFFEMVLELQGGDDEDVSVDELLAGIRRRIGRKGEPAAEAPKHTQEGWKVADEIFDALAAAGTPAAPPVSGGVPDHEHEATIGKVKKKP